VRCRQCETVIADNALICYRCGAAVEDLPSLPPVHAGRPRRRLVLLLAVAALAIAALFTWWLAAP